MSRRTVPHLAAAAFVLLLAGCGSKGKYEGKITVKAGRNLEAMGVSVVDWRYSESGKSFGIKLKASKEVPKSTFLTLSGPGIGNAASPIPAGEHINKADWIDYADVQLGDLPKPGEEPWAIVVDTR